MKHTIKFIIVLFSLVVTGTTSVWGITEDDIIVNVLPNSSAGTVTVAVLGMNVTITATPATDYYIDASHIIAEKMVEPSVSHHAPGLSSSLPISGSNPFTFTIPDGYTGAYVTVNFYKKSEGFTQITSLSEITDMTGKYQLTADVSGLSSSLGEFRGTLDGGLHKIIGSSAPLFTSTDGAIIRNIIFEDVNISSGDGDGDAGAVTSKAKGATRIYNCGILPTSVERDDKGNITGFYGSNVGGIGNVGGLVGTLSGTARVINCFSYANITGGANKGGIVGSNEETSTQASLTTMVMNCLFYGEISSGGNVSPIYGGTEINNVEGGLNNYNYYRYHSSYSTNKLINKYNRALAMEEKFITRFERYRLLLNSNKKLAAKYTSTATVTVEPNDMAKWVLETADRTIENPYPYPVLKAQGYYPSIINPDIEHAPDSASVGRNHGGKLGKTLIVHIAGVGSGAPTGAKILRRGPITLQRTDKDTTRFNFNYDKVQLPYYNDYGTKNYTGNRVVTGWKITSITGGTAGTFNEADEWGGYNFADRKCTNKDLYSVSKRVFSQGAYWDVPEGVTAITIEPYWAIANYVSDATYDVVYDNAYAAKSFSPFGTQYANNSDIDIYGDGKKQKVYTSIGSAIGNFDSDNKTVYDQAVVLVGNVHQYANPTNTNKPYTVMSIDMNHDNEPDYSYIFSHDNRRPIDPIRYDFLNIMGIAEAQIPNGASLLRNVSIFNLKGWFEITNTCLVNFSQFEIENSQASQNAVAKSPAPLILLGGTYEQIASTQKTSKPASTQYIHVGGNAWFAKFGNGTHSDGTGFTPHIPVSVTGGDYDEFYLSGTYQPDITNMESDNAECYISGGRFGEMAGASMEAIQGDVQWDINWADITNFYGGGVNAVNPITGKIQVDITNSYVNQYCGGPKFGDMEEDKTVTTNAIGCVFGTYFGAGYGGNAYKRLKYKDVQNTEPAAHQGDYSGERGKYYNGATSSTSYGKKGKGVATDFDYEFFVWSTGGTGSRFYVKFVTFSLATTRGVTSSLTNCKVTGNVYGGGSLGKVDGNVSTTLKDCEVSGNVFGAGYSATLPKVGVRKTPAFIAGKAPTKNMNIGMFEPGEINTTEEYEWKQVATSDLSNGGTGMVTQDGKNYVYTDTNLSALGTVTGNATLNIEGTTTVGGSVYGGGEESGVDGNTEVTVNGGFIGTEGRSSYGYRYGNVYGGGKGKIDNEGNLVVSSVADLDAGLVKGNTSVTINGTKETTKIVHNVYGGGAVGSVGTFARDANGNPTACTSGGQATVTINGGQVGHNRKDSGMVNGSSRGWEGNPNGEGAFAFLDQLAWVNNGTVIIGDATTDDKDKGPAILGSVYGGGENGHNYNDGIVTINKGTIGNTASIAATYDCGNVYGAGCGTDTYTIGEDPTEHHNQKAGWVRGITTITVNGGNILRNVYGGGSMGSVGNDTDAESGKVTITINGGTIGRTEDNDHGHVFGGPKGSLTETEFKASVKSTLVNINAHPSDATKNPIVWGSVFGGGEAGIIKGSVAVNMNGGTVKKDVYGGGALADTQTSNWDATTNSGAGDWATGKTSASATTTVRLKGGDILGEAYGGGLGEDGKPAYVWGDVLVDLNGTTSSGETGTAIAGNTRGCTVRQVFGCNNVNGTPKGDVMVHVYATQSTGKADISTKPETGLDTYDVSDVYGGGNLASYNPVTPSNGTSGSKTKVIIEGCSLTSIETVYGGGNAAAVPETDVVIKGAYEIGYLFGGGNGKDDIAPGVPNPGADVGTLDHGTSTYGTGNANTLMEGGLIHEAYGGSNTKGIIKGSINQITDPKDPADPEYCCDLEVVKIVGAGKYADVDGDVNMTLSCQPSKKVDLLFAGADEANVNGNITLNITNGHFGKVFGGNNLGGVVKGKITVNVEETGCQPIKIDDLYLGGNEAAYSVFGYYESNETHDVTGKKILKPRESATDPRKPVKYDGTEYASISDFTNYDQPELNIISCTYIGNVFGGGLGAPAKMYANPTVNVNMEPGRWAETAVPAMMEELHLDVTKTAPNPNNLGIIRNVFGGGDAADIEGSTTVNIATVEGKSAYIIGSVFGGGNAADVLGNTNVTMSGGYVFNGIFGGGYAGSVGTFTRSTAATDVNIFEHTAHDGCIGKPVSCAEGTGKCTVLVNGGQIGPISVALATEGMNRKDKDGKGIPVPEGWVWGAGQGLVEDPATHPDTHFTSYVGSTDVTIGGTALIMESIIGGGEFGRVLGDTKVTIQDHCQIGVGEGMVDANNKPIRYTDGYDYGAGATTNQFVNPLTTTITNSNALAECSHYPYGKVIGGKKQYLPYDPYYDDNKTYADAHDLGPASTSDPSDGKTWIGCVFGGGSGYMPFKKEDDPGYDWVRSAGWVEGNSEVRISGGHILTNVYGGNEVTDVKGKSIVKMTGGTIGVPRTLEQIAAHPLSCYLFGAGKGDDRSHFYDYTNVGSVEVEISGGIIYGSVFGGSEDGHVTGDIDLTIRKGDDFTIGSTTYTNGPIIGTWGTSYVDGNVFGAGRGFSGNTLTAGNVGGNVTLNISGGNILGSVYGGGRLASVGTYLVETTDANYGKQIPDVGNDKHGHITINITDGTIGNDKEYIYNPTAEQKAAIPNTTFDYQNHLQYTKGGNVFTAGMGRLYALDNTTALSSWQKLGQCKSTTLNMTGGTVKSSVYGGGEIGIVAQNATLNIDGGTVGTKVVDSNDANKYYYFGSVFGGGKGSTENIDGISAAGTTQGNVEVHLNKTVSSDDDAKGAIVHQVFGCNDMNGSPKGDVTVHVYATQNADKANISSKPDKDTDTYDVMAVYGGGNLAAYEPTDLSTGKTNVIIDGCRLTSIRQVYGGGNAASTPATNVEVNGTYEILELFGGGNGADKLPNGDDNPGANVGYKDYHLVENDPAYATKEARTEGDAFAPYRYGTGEATVNIKGGTIHRVFGGSNTKGNVRKTALTMLEEVTEGGEPKCPFCVDEAYGGGKSAPMDAEAKLLMACIPGLNEVYGGAEAADIHDDVSLTITNGNFNRVFGGNNISGTISGKITVNVEETGCRPVIIGELYGGGNLAAYSVYGYKEVNEGTTENPDMVWRPRTSSTDQGTGPSTPFDAPEVNVRSFTSIGAVYGGGYGAQALMVASPTVNISESVGDPDTYPTTGDDYTDAGFKGKTITVDGHEVVLPEHTKNKIGAINNVFGGGNAAPVQGDTQVNIGTAVGEDVYLVKAFKTGDTLPAECYTKSGNNYVKATTGTAQEGITYYRKYPVVGVDIRGNVYGGGNNAEVTGNTNVNIGKRAE